MTAPAAVRLFAGFMLALSLTLTHFVSPWFLILTGFVGANLSQFALTNFCPAASAMKLFGLKAECPARKMTVSRGTSLGAGLVVLTGVLATVLSGSLVPVTVIAGAVSFSMAQSAFSGWCPMMTVARWAHLPDGQLSA